MFNLQIVGLDALMNNIHKAGGDATPLIKAAMFNSVTEIQKNAREDAPIKTGALKRSILTTVSYPNAYVTVNVPYGMFVENGTKPHLIMPKNKKALFWNGALNPYKVIHHPGTKANPFFSKGINESLTYVQEQMVHVAQRLIREMAGH